MYMRIKAVRKSVGMSQRAFGESLGASRDIISNIEQGRQAISDTLVRLICKVYNVNEHWLRTGEGEMRCEETVDEKLRSWVDEVLSGRPENIRYAFLTVMSNLDDDGWKRIADFVEQVYCETHSTTPEEIDREKDRLQLADEIEESENQMEELYPSDGRNIV